MPQLFQVLKCYKCSIFQVHQTKKDNKWKCKVCSEKQSVKRHYGVGIAKECRMHVQKLNKMQGDIEESKLKAIDSDSSNENVDNDVENKIPSTEVIMDNTKKESKWSAFIEKEEISVEEKPEYIDDIEVCLELPQKRKLEKKSKPFKVPKASNDRNNKTEIFNVTSLSKEEISLVNEHECIDDVDVFLKLPQKQKASKPIKPFKVPRVTNESSKKTEVINNFTMLSSNELNNIYSHNNNATVLNSKNCAKVQHEFKVEKEIIDKHMINQINKASKWAQYIEHDNTEIIDHNECIGFDKQKKLENYDDDNISNSENELCQDENFYDQDIMGGNENRSNSIQTEDDSNPKNIFSKPIFSLCDDNELDDILKF